MEYIIVTIIIIGRKGEGRKKERKKERDNSTCSPPLLAI